MLRLWMVITTFGVGQLFVPAFAYAQRGIAETVGLNHVDRTRYGGTWEGRLSGAEQDARAFAQLAAANHFEVHSLLGPDATRAALLARIDRAAATLRAGDIFLLTFSGHGGQFPDQADPSKTLDDTYCLYDGQVLDKELGEKWTTFQPGVRILLLSDSCHSGTVLYIGSRETLQTTTFANRDTPASLGEARGWLARVAASVSTTSRNIAEDEIARKLARLFSPDETVAATADSYGFRFMPPSVQSRVNKESGNDLAKRLVAIGKTHQELRDQTTAHALALSACQDAELAWERGGHGVFTSAVLSTWQNGAYRGTYKAFLGRVADAISAGRIPQHPNFYPMNSLADDFAIQQPFLVKAPAVHAAAAAAPRDAPPAPTPGSPPTDTGATPPGATDAATTLREGIPLIVWDFRQGTAAAQLLKAPSKDTVEAINQAAGECGVLDISLTGSVPLTPRVTEVSASAGIQIAILYTPGTAKPTYDLKLTNLTPRIEDQLSGLLPKAGPCEPKNKAIVKYFAATSAWADFSGDVTSPAGVKTSIDTVFGPAYHWLLPGSIAVTSVRELKYNATTNMLEARDTPKTGYMGIGYSILKDVYEFGPFVHAFVSTASRPLDSFGIAAGIRGYHFHIAGPIHLEQFGVSYGVIWTRSDQTASVANTKSHLVGKGRLLVTYDLASLLKLLKSTSATTTNKDTTKPAAGP